MDAQVCMRLWIRDRMHLCACVYMNVRGAGWGASR